MMKIILLALAITAFGCTAESDAETAATGAVAENAGADTRGGEPAASANDGWTAVVEGGETLLPAIDGDHLDAVRRGPTIQLNGIDDAAKLMVTFNVDGEPATQSYEPYLFSIGWTAEGTTCLGGKGLTVELTSLEPMGGTFEGPVACMPDGNPAGKWNATVRGSFGENV